MRIKLAHQIHRLRSSFWVVPAISIVSAILVAALLVAFDHEYSDWIVDLAPWLKQVSPEGTTTLLGTAASSVLGLAGITFSGTLVALTLASSQFGPRLLRNFIHANTTQVTLGVLLATHVYCLFVMRNVRSGVIEFVPHAATFGAFLLTLASLGMFIAFIQHVVASIQAEKVVAEVYKELSQSIDRFFGEGSGSDDEGLREQESECWEACDGEKLLTQKGAGYVQAFDVDQLVAMASEGGHVFRVLVEPGSFIVDGGNLLAWAGGDELSEERRRCLRGCFIMGPERTAEQDLEYCARQLVEIALRALSPSINDPFTAMNCIDYLGASLVSIAKKELPQKDFHDEDGAVRVRTRPATFSSFLRVACNQIRLASTSKFEVSIRLLRTLLGVGRQCRSPRQIAVIQEQTELISEAVCGLAVDESDRQILKELRNELQELG